MTGKWVYHGRGSSPHPVTVVLPRGQAAGTTSLAGLTRGWASHNIACGGYFMQNKFNKPIVFAMNSNCEFEINASALFFSSLHMENQDLQLTIY